MKKQQRNTVKKRYIFTDMAQEWLEYSKLHVKKSTYMNYDYLLKKHILPFFGQMNMRSITVAEVNRFIADKLANGRLKRSGGVSKKYLQDMLVIVKSVAGYCEQVYGIPVKIRQTMSLHAKKPEIKVLDKSDKRKLTDAVTKNVTSSKLGIMLALYTGMRIGEVCGLKWSDFNEEDGTITINRTVQRISDGKGSTELLVGTPKTSASQRVIPLPDFISALLSKIKGTPEQPIISSTSEYVEPSYLRKQFRRILSACKIKNFRFHDLRHTFATECVRLNFDTKTLSEILGHTNVSLTLNRYVHSSIEIKRKYMSLVTI